MSNVARGKHLNLVRHYPHRRRRKNMTHVLKTEVCLPISQLPQPDKWPSFHFPELANVGLVSIQKTTDLCDTASLTALKSSMAKLRRRRHSKQEGADVIVPWCQSTSALFCWKFIQRSRRNQDPCHMCCSQTTNGNCLPVNFILWTTKLRFCERSCYMTSQLPGYSAVNISAIRWSSLRFAFVRINKSCSWPDYHVRNWRVGGEKAARQVTAVWDCGFTICKCQTSRYFWRGTMACLHSWAMSTFPVTISKTVFQVATSPAAFAVTKL